MRTTVSQTIRAPIDRVFEVFTDVEHLAGRVSGIKRVEVLSPIRAGKGLRWSETRVMFGDDASAEKEVTAFEPPRSFRVESRVGGTNYVSTYEFAAGAEAGTTVATWIHDSVALTFAAKFAWPMLFLFRGVMRKAMAQDLADVASFLERAG